MFTRCFARFLQHFYKVFCKAFVQHFYKVFCKAFTTFLQGVLQGLYNIFTRSSCKAFVQHFYKVFCKAFTTFLQGVLQGLYNIFTRSSCKAFTTFLQGLLARLMFLGAERSPQDSVSRPHDLLYIYIYFHSRMLQAHFVSGRSFVGFCSRRSKQQGLFWELNPGPLAPEARIIPLDQTANWYRIGLKILEEQKHVDQTFVLGRASSCEDQPHCLLSVLVIEYGRSGD